MYILENFYDYSFNGISLAIKKWQMAIFIRLICGERISTLGHRCSSLSSSRLYGLRTL